MKLAKPRLAPLREDQWSDEVRQILKPMIEQGRVFNIFKTLAHHPNLMRRWLVFGNHVLFKSTLSARERELLILRIGWLCQAEYEWGQHVRIGREAGLTDEEIHRIKTGPEAGEWNEQDRLLLTATDELHTNAHISDPTWQRRHWATIVHSYSRAKYFAMQKQLFEELYLRTDDQLLSHINHRFIVAICRILGIRTTVSWSMDYNLIGDKTGRLVHLCQQAGATAYLSGPSAKAYLDEELFRNEGIAVSYMDYSGYPEYRQLYPPFEPRISIIDLIFNEGLSATRYMKSF